VANSTQAFYKKDTGHSLYRYPNVSTKQEIWHICHYGVTCYYDAPPASDGASDPPASGWLVSPGATGVAPPPTAVVAIRM
jgi:hypothetical protein